MPNCSPVVLKSDPFRIAYVANGMWQLQHDTNHKGINAVKAGKTILAKAHFDRWQPVMRPAPFDIAKAQLAARDSTKRN